MNERSENYIQQILKLPKSGADRLVFFQDYLEDEEEMLARDAYDEFARAPYDHVIAMKDRMNHAQLVAWIKDPDIPASRRRLYLTMLGVCGSAKDIPMLESVGNPIVVNPSSRLRKAAGRRGWKICHWPVAAERV